MRTWNMNN